MRSSTPPASPARTMLEYMRSKTFSCLAMASESEVPPETSSTRSRRTSLKGPARVCPSRMVSDLTMGMPASERVASWVVNSVTIWAGIRPRRRLPRPAPGAAAAWGRAAPEGRGTARWILLAMLGVALLAGG